MPLYFLYTRVTGSSDWTYSGYQLKIDGNDNNNLHVHWRPYDKSNPPSGSGGWNNVSGAQSSGSGNPDSPQNGDELTLPSSIGTIADLTGDGGYDSAGEEDMGAGYYPGDSPEQTDADWCATSN